MTYTNANITTNNNKVRVSTALSSRVSPAGPTLFHSVIIHISTVDVEGICLQLYVLLPLQRTCLMKWMCDCFFLLCGRYEM